MSEKTGTPKSESPELINFLVLLLFILFLTLAHSCRGNQAAPNEDNSTTPNRNARLGLWLAKKDELIEHESAAFDLVMTAWFEPDEAADIRKRHPSAKLLAGLSLN
jgi:hypothetical protein